MVVEGRWLSFSMGWCLSSMLIFRGVCFNYFLSVLLIIWFTISMLIWKCQWSNRKYVCLGLIYHARASIGICSHDRSHLLQFLEQRWSHGMWMGPIWFDTILHASQYPKIWPRYWDSRTNFWMNNFQQLEWKIKKWCNFICFLETKVIESQLQGHHHVYHEQFPCIYIYYSNIFLSIIFIPFTHVFYYSIILLFPLI